MELHNDYKLKESKNKTKQDYVKNEIDHESIYSDVYEKPVVRISDREFLGTFEKDIENFDRFTNMMKQSRREPQAKDSYHTIENDEFNNFQRLLEKHEEITGKLKIFDKDSQID